MLSLSLSHPITILGRAKVSSEVAGAWDEVRVMVRIRLKVRFRGRFRVRFPNSNPNLNPNLKAHKLFKERLSTREKITVDLDEEEDSESNV
jgi:hypothetical protein